MTVQDIRHMHLLEIKGLPIEQLEAICAEPRPVGDLAFRRDDARYALSLRRCPRRPS